MSKLSELQETLSELIDAGAGLGIEDQLDNFAVELSDSLIGGLEEWGESCQRLWADNAPWQTENLRDSVAYDTNEEDIEAWVGVDVDRLLSVAGQELPFRRCEYVFNQKGKIVTIDSQVMPDYDYTEEADKNAVSAGGANPPAGEGTPTPFIEEIWYVLAKNEQERIFA